MRVYPKTLYRASIIAHLLKDRVAKPWVYGIFFYDCQVAEMYQNIRKLYLVGAFWAPLLFA